jgi:hypothetical protein
LVIQVNLHGKKIPGGKAEYNFLELGEVSEQPGMVDI